MKLPFALPHFKKQGKPEYFLALLLRDEKVSAVILEELVGKIRTVGSHEEFFSTSIEQIREEEWLSVLDKAISKAEESLPNAIETHKTVFGVKEEWVEDSRIKKEYLTRLKKASEELDLSPLGFLIINEAIVHLIQQEEGAPVTAILADIGKQNVSISLVRGGKVIETKHALIEENVPHTVDELLKQLSAPEVLPSRLLLLDSDLGEELSQMFIAHQWSKSLPFLHVPQISVLPKSFDGRAVVFGAAKQMGFDILETAGFTEGLKPIDNNKAIEIQEKPVSATDSAEESQSDSSFGFVLNEDIARIDADRMNEEDDSLSIVNTAKEKPVEETVEPEASDIKRVTSNMPSFVKGTLQKIRIPKIPPLPSDNKIILIPPIVFILLIGSVLFYIFAMKASVTIAVSPTVVEDKASIIFSTSSANDFTKQTITARPIDLSLEGNLTANVTGKKDVGEKAKGTVTLYNSSEGKKVLPQGTVIVSSNGLEFLLDKEVVIASSSGDIFSGIKAGTAQVSVTAKTIGTESNLPSSSKFTIDNSTTLAAKNDEAFSGGSKKTVTVVDKKDIDALLSKLPKELEKKAKEEIEKKIESDEVLIPIFTNIVIGKKEFDRDVGEEAKTVKVTGKVVFTAMAYKKSDFLSFSQSLLRSKMAKNQTLSKEGVKGLLSDIKKVDEKQVKSVLAAKASLFPEISKDELVSKIVGKSSDETIKIIQKLPQIESVEISYFPKIPFIPEFLPRIKKNITLMIQMNE